MKNQKSIYLPVLILLMAGMVFASNYYGCEAEYEIVANNEDSTSSEKEAFDKMMDVLTHQRCMNCHPNDNVPKQGDDSYTHYFGISRGEGNLGFDATKCATCHQLENNDYSGVPGSPEWSLAPEKMKWEGLTKNS